MSRSLAVLALLLAHTALAAEAPPDPRAFVDAQLQAHSGQTGTFVLDRGEQSLLARAWLVDHARESVEIQYFIWSTDNIGILASESLLRAASRGVKVRVIVDDVLMQAPDKTLLALAKHPNIDIRIYNPVHSVGVPWYKRLLNMLRNFRGANQRMHDKTLVVDGQLAITGGRNMADEYYDYDHEYNFRDRDALVVGAVVPQIRQSFERFWASALSVAVEQIYAGHGLMRQHVTVDDAEIQKIYADLTAYAADRRNFAPEVRAAIEAIPENFPALAAAMAWGRVDFISDIPGKNDGRSGYGGGGLSTSALARLLQGAQREVLIQSPYLVLSDPALALFRDTIARGVKIRISTNSLASTDNVQAFGGYRRQRAKLLAMGIEIHEYKPDPAVQRQVMQRYEALRAKAPIFALHAKTMVVDRSSVYVGTYNLDPRSENLNTEVGVIIHHAGQAGAVATAIETDMHAENSWNTATDKPDRFASRGKRLLVWFWGMMPVKALL
jgi:putative cardiolipin synthase